MPNTLRRPVGVDPFNPKGQIEEGLANVLRPDGSAFTQMAEATGKLATTLGGIADDLTRQEGNEAGKIAGLDPHYRPDGSLTTRGKAFNDAATQTYLNNLDASMRNDLQSAFEANKNDPAALKKAYDTLHGEYIGQHVFPQIRSDFESQFARLRMPYENKALSNMEDDTKDANRASGITALTAIQTNAARMVAADPNNPQTTKNVDLELDKADKTIDGMVAKEAITAAAGEKQRIGVRDSIIQGHVLGQAATLKTPEDVAAFRGDIKKRFADGGFKRLSGDGYAAIDSGLQALENTVRTRSNADVAQLSKNVGDFVERRAGGLDTPAAEWTGYQTSAAAQTPKGAQVMAIADGKIKVATAMSNMSVDDAGRFVMGLRSQASKGGATAPDADVIAFAEAQLDKQRKALNTDQLGYAAQKRLIPAVAPVDFQAYDGSADAAAGIAAQIRDRTAQAHAVGSSLSRSPQFLRPDERDRLKEIVDKGGPAALNLAGAIVKGADNDAPAILREISTDAPVLAQAGNIIANGGSLQAARDAFTAARVKAETGKELPGVTPSVAQAATRDTFGAAFMMQGEDGNRIRTTADAIARARLNGADPKGSEAETIYKRSLQEAAGAQFVGGVQYGGVVDYKPGYWASYKVPVPSDIRADKFRDVVRSLGDSDLQGLTTPPQAPDGKPYKAADIAGSIPVAVRGGYRFAMGDPTSGDPKYIRGADGGPFVLSFDDIKKFAPRVSGALLGGN